MGRKKTHEYEYMIGRIKGGDFCMWLENEGQVPKQLQRVPLPLDGPDPVPVGTRFSKLDGPNTSGSFRTVDIVDPSVLVYEGMLVSLEGRFVIFRPEPLPDCYWPKGIPCYALIEDEGYCELMYMHRYNAPNFVQLSQCEYETPN